MIIVKMASSLQKGLEYREFQEVMVSRYCKILNKSPGLIDILITFWGTYMEEDLYLEENLC